MTAGLTDLCKILKALGDEPRLRIVYSLHGGGEHCVSQFTAMLGLSMATVSKHLNVLQEAGLVHSRKEERWVYYRLAPSFPTPVRRWLATAAAERPVLGEDRKILACYAGNPELAIAHCRKRTASKAARRKKAAKR